MNRKKCLLGACLSIAVCAMLLPLPSAVGSGPGGTDYAQDNWPMFRHDLEHSGAATSAGPATNHTLWTYQTGDDILSSPAASGSSIFFGSDDFGVYCVDAATGSLSWNFSAGNRVRTSPAVFAGRVFAGSDSPDNTLYCLDEDGYLDSTDDGLPDSHAGNSDLIWNFTTDGAISSSPAVKGDRLYFGTNMGQVYCLYTTNGTVAWNFSKNNDPYIYGFMSSPALAHGNVFIGCDNGAVYCIDELNGTLVWECMAGGQIKSSPAVAGGNVFFGSYDGGVFSVPETDPNSDYSIEPSEFNWNYTTGNWVVSSPAVSDGKVFIGSKDRQLYCLNESDGTLVWNFEAPKLANAAFGEQNGFLTSPAVANGWVYASSWDNKVYCLDADGYLDGSDDGAADSHVNNSDVVWSFEAGVSDPLYGFVSSPIVAFGRLYVGGMDGVLYCFEDEAAPEFPAISALVSCGIALAVGAAAFSRRQGKD